MRNFMVNSINVQEQKTKRERPCTATHRHEKTSNQHLTYTIAAFLAKDMH